MKIRVAVAGVTGWTGSRVTLGICKANDMEFLGGIAPKHKGAKIGEILDDMSIKGCIVGSIEELIEKKLDLNVLVDYTTPDVVKKNVIKAIENNIHVVIGTSGLTDSDFEDIENAAKKQGIGVISAGNFSITAGLMERFALISSDYIKHWEIIEYADANKRDAPSGTVRQLVYKLAKKNKPILTHSIEETVGYKEARGASINDQQVHAIRLPGYVMGVEIVFGLDGERLSIKHEAGNSADIYVKGTLMAIRKVQSTVGLVRGLESIL
jgi:4-hydroxy-tetrahydrodipicolinate reductase